MILSHKNKFIFIKTRKTAGTSMEVALSKYCGKDDVITPLKNYDDPRPGLGYRGPQNYRKETRQFSSRNWGRLLLKGNWPEYYNHMPAAQIRRYAGPEIWESYFKFCIERNPWDKIISYYYYWHKNDNSVSLDNFISSDIAKHLRGFDMYSLDGRSVSVDKIARFEDLDNEIIQIAETIGLPEVPVLSRENSETRIDRRHFTEVLNRNQIARIADLFEDEIRLMGYDALVK